MDCFTADYLQFFTKKRQKLTLGGRLATQYQISGIFLKLTNF